MRMFDLGQQLPPNPPVVSWLIDEVYFRCNGFAVSEYIRYLVSQVQSTLELEKDFEKVVNLFVDSATWSLFGFYLFFGLILFLIISRSSIRPIVLILFNIFFLLILFTIGLMLEAEPSYILGLFVFANGIFFLVLEMLVISFRLIVLLGLAHAVHITQSIKDTRRIKLLYLLIEEYISGHQRMVHEKFKDCRMRLKVNSRQRNSMDEVSFQEWKRAWLPLRPCEKVPRGRFHYLLLEENSIVDIPFEERGHYQYCPTLDMLVYCHRQSITEDGALITG